MTYRVSEIGLLIMSLSTWARESVACVARRNVRDTPSSVFSGNKLG